MSRLVRHVASNWKVISLTFEIFWIVVFILRAAGSEASRVAEFVYVNF